MDERLNFIFIGDRKINTNEHRKIIQYIASILSDIDAVFLDVMIFNESSGNEIVELWESNSLLDKEIGEEDVMAVYFSIADANYNGRQNISIFTCESKSAITVSLKFNSINGKNVIAIFDKITSYAFQNFKEFHLACGPELDLYETNNKITHNRIQDQLSSDPRCWHSISASSYPDRIKHYLNK